ncbi:MAG: glycosyltransferase family 4 protein [Alphaproteobacteria bacterium]|nr:glycosyltransferase family 4 protein [Alphaproteobacteria bacterium]
MVLLQVTPRLEAGGVEQVTLDIARAAARAGATSLVASAGGGMERDLLRGGARLARLPLNAKDPIRLALNALRLWRLIRRERVDLVHVRSRAPALSALLACRAARVPLVATYHGIYAAGSTPKRLYNRVMTKGCAVIANSQFTRDHVLAEHPAAATRLHVVPEGIDVARFDPAAVPMSRVLDARRAMGLAEDVSAPVILLAARLTGWKGQAFMIETLARLSPDRLIGEPPVLVLAGSEERAGEARRLADLAERLGLGARVRLPGPLEDMPAAYLAADLVVAPSTAPESFGRGVAEAGAMGAAVIASDLGAVTETVRPGVTGWLVPPGDAEAWTQALITALNLPRETRARLGQAARTHIAANHSLERMVAASFTLYRQVLETWPHPPGRNLTA